MNNCFLKNQSLACDMRRQATTMESVRFLMQALDHKIAAMSSCPLQATRYGSCSRRGCVQIMMKALWDLLENSQISSKVTHNLTIRQRLLYVVLWHFVNTQRMHRSCPTGNTCPSDQHRLI